MGNAAFLLIPVGVAALGLLVIGLFAFLDRPRPEDAMADFRRGLDALAGRNPRSGRGRRGRTR